MIFDAWELDIQLVYICIVPLTSLRKQQTGGQKCKVKLVFYYFIPKILKYNSLILESPIRNLRTVALELSETLTLNLFSLWGKSHPGYSGIWVQSFCEFYYYVSVYVC